MTTATIEGKRARKRDALVGAAHALFRAQGFEATTIDQIAAAAGVSRRTYFRYFATKDAVVFPHAAARIARFREALRPRRGETVQVAVRRAAVEVAREFAEHRDELLLQHALIASSPALLAREHELDMAWEDAIVAALEGELPAGDERPLRARVLAGAIAGALRAALRAWLDGKGRADLAALGARALDLLGDGFSGWAASPPPALRTMSGAPVLGRGGLRSERRDDSAAEHEAPDRRRAGEATVQDTSERAASRPASPRRTRS